MILVALLVEAWDLQTFSKFVSLDFLREDKNNVLMWESLEGNIPPNLKVGQRECFDEGTLMRESLEGKIPPNPGNECESSEESDNRPTLFNSPKILIVASM